MSGHVPGSGVPPSPEGRDSWQTLTRQVARRSAAKSSPLPVSPSTPAPPSRSARVSALAVTVVDVRRVVTPPGDPSASVAVTVTTAGQAHNRTFDYTSLRLDVIRPNDLLRLTFELVNLKVQGGRLVRMDPGSPATVIVGLPPQHLAEASTPVGSVPGHPPLASVVAGGSRLAFTVPDDSLSLDLPTLLGWASLVPVPPDQPAGKPGRPGGSVLELPNDPADAPAQPDVIADLVRDFNGGPVYRGPGQARRLAAAGRRAARPVSTARRPIRHPPGHVPRPVGRTRYRRRQAAGTGGEVRARGGRAGSAA